jgi:hypothetical protein
MNRTGYSGSGGILAGAGDGRPRAVAYADNIDGPVPSSTIGELLAGKVVEVRGRSHASCGVGAALNAPPRE